jgi:hypothetical protein
MSAFRIVTRRPLLIAIGARATAALDTEHDDLELVDAIAIDDVPPAFDAAADELLRDRTMIVCMFDAADEDWRLAEWVARQARQRTPFLLLFVYSDRRSGEAPQPGSLLRIAGRVSACVVWAPRECTLLNTSLLVMAALFRAGLTGISGEALATFMCSGTVFTARTGSCGGAGDHTVAHVVVVKRCSANTPLDEINDTWLRARSHFPTAHLVIATPTYSLPFRGPDETWLIASTDRVEDRTTNVEGGDHEGK